MGWAELVAAAQAPEAEPLARVTLRPNPYVSDQAMDWSLLGDFDGTGPLDGATTDNDVLIVVHADGKYKIITDGQSMAQWNAAWSNFPTDPAGCTWTVDVEIFAIATDGTDTQVFARRTAAAWTIFVNETNDDGASWNGWVAIGTSTYTNGATNYVIGAAIVDTVFLRHYETTEGVCLEVFNNEGAVPWQRYELETNLRLQVPPPNGGCDVVEYGDIAYIYLTALSLDYPDVYGYRIYLTTFHQGVWGPVDYLMMADVPDIVDSSESLFGFHIGNIYGLTYDTRDAMAPAIGREDNFDGYGDLWLKVADFEVDENWIWIGPAGSSAVFYVEAARSVYINSTGINENIMSLAVDLDLSIEGRFTDDDYVYIAFYIVDLANMDNDGFLRLNFFDGADTFRKEWAKAALSEGWNFEKIKKSDFVVVGAPSWATIDFLQVYTHAGTAPGGNTRIHCDDWRTVKADPNDVTAGNDTGIDWDFPDGEWHVYEEDDEAPARITLGQIDVDTGVEKFAIRGAYPAIDDYEIVTEIKAKRDDGLLGIAFRMTDTTAGSEDGYALVADTTNNLLRLYEFTNGAKAELAQAAFVFNLDTWYYLGVRAIGSQIQGFCSVTEDTLFDALRINVTDASYATGQMGLASQDTVARFDNFATDVQFEGGSRKALQMSSTPGVWPSPVLYEIANYSYPRERIVWQGDYWYAFDESDASFIVVQALSPFLGGADVLCPAETIQIHLPLIQASATSSQADVTLSNVYGEFDNSGALETGAEIQIEGGYKWTSGEEYAYLFTGIINRISESLAENAMTITAYDYVHKLKHWASNQLFIFKSQFKVWLRLRTEDDTKHLVDIIEGFTYDTDNEWYRSNTAATENMVLHGEYFRDVVVATCAYFVDSFTDAWFGVILRSDSTGENCYGALWNYAADTLQIRKKTDGVWGAALATVAAPAKHSASLRIRAEIIHDTIYVWTSSDGRTWTYRISYADTSPLEEGHVGFAATPATAKWVDLKGFKIFAFDTEKTVEYLMRQIATMAGVMSFNFEDEIYDDFTGTDGDPPSSDNWRNTEKTLTTADIASNRLRCIAPNATWGYLNSTVSRKTFVLNFRVNIPNDAEPACIVFRANTTFTIGYRLEIVPGAVGTADIRLSFLDDTLIISIKPRVAIPTGTNVDFTLSVQDNYGETESFISLWMGERLIFTTCDWAYSAPGYVGVGKYDDDNACHFDNFNIDKLDTPVVSRGEANYFVINVGETADSLIGELAAIQNARWFFDGTGVFTAGLLEPEAGTADVLDSTKSIITLYNELYIGSRERDDEDWVSHVRVTANNGMYADSYDDALLSQKGYRFKRISIEADLSATQCQEVADKYIEQQQKSGDTSSFSVTPAQLGLTRRMRFHAHAHRFPRDTTSPLKIDQDFIVNAQRISMKREPSPDWDMQIEPGET